MIIELRYDIIKLFLWLYYIRYKKSTIQISDSCISNVNSEEEMIDIYILQQLVAYTDCVTLSAAAEKLHTVQPAMTRSMLRMNCGSDTVLTQ